MTVKRYDMRQIFDGRMVMLDVRDGGFVSHDDYTSLLAESEDLKLQVINLAVENAALKQFGETLYKMRNDLNGTGTGIQGSMETACQQVAMEAAMDAFDEITTPTTDAAIASIQSQGVEMFADECENDVVFVEPEDAEHYVLMAEHARGFAAQLRKGAAV